MPAQWSLPMPGTVRVIVLGGESLIACLLRALPSGRPTMAVLLPESVTLPVSDGPRGPRGRRHSQGWPAEAAGVARR